MDDALIVSDFHRHTVAPLPPVGLFLAFWVASRCSRRNRSGSAHSHPRLTHAAGDGYAGDRQRGQRTRFGALGFVELRW